MPDWTRFSDKEKKIYRKLEKIWEEQNKLPMVKLDVPKLQGWYVNHYLREDILRGPKGEDLKQALNLGTKSHVIFGKKHVKNIRAGKYTFISQRWDFKLKKMVDYEASHVHVRNFSKEYFTQRIPEKLHKYFKETTDGRGKPQFRLSFPKYYYKLKLKKRYITEVRQFDPKLDSEEKKLDNHLYRLNFWKKYHGHKYHDYHYKYRTYRKRNENKAFNDAKSQIESEEELNKKKL